VDYGIGTLTDTYLSTGPDSNYHYGEISGLLEDTLYDFQVSSRNSGDETTGGYYSIPTLKPPPGIFLFTFVVLTDFHYAEGKSDTMGGRGRLYSHCQDFIPEIILQVNGHVPDFTVLLGDLTESGGGGYAHQISAIVKPILDTLTGNDILGDGFNYFPVPGNHDKVDSSADWSTNFDLLTGSRVTYNPTEDSSFNYSFDYMGHHFVMLDSVQLDGDGKINLSWLYADLLNNINKPTFLFHHHPAGDFFLVPSENIINATAYQSILGRFKQIIGVFSGHVHDNSLMLYRSSFFVAPTTDDFYNEVDIDGIPIIRTASSIQYPVGFRVVHVYSQGYQTIFYQTSSEFSPDIRQLITDEAPLPANVWQQLWLGNLEGRSFSIEHTFTPSGSTIPASNIYTYALVLIVFGFLIAVKQSLGY